MMRLTSWRNSKGQTQQVFLFFIAVIIIIATIWLGGKLFSVVASTSCETGDAQFERTLFRVFDENSEYGSRNTVSVEAPCDAQRLCFVDATMVSSPDSPTFLSDDPAMNAVIQQGGKVNVFIRGKENFAQFGYDERIVVGNGEEYVCYDATRGVFEMRIEGGGRFLTLS